ncbi:hypothetical protein, partial [Bradyrhizobium sp. NAS96.2]|uniref:hypothetical protein n=1 Tax=Bradyrhizobium sp. NAS96.2 TaxID=1680160 RepID=UPI001AED0328
MAGYALAAYMGRAALIELPPDNWKYNVFRFRECKSGTISKTDCAAPVDLFRAEKIATVPDRLHHDCRFCGVKLTLVR